MPRVQTVIAAMLLASCCVGTSLMAQQRTPNTVFVEAAKATAQGHASQAQAKRDAAVVAMGDSSQAGEK